MGCQPLRRGGIFQHAIDRQTECAHADPARAIPGDQVFAAIRARHADRLKKRREPQN